MSSCHALKICFGIWLLVVLPHPFPVNIICHALLRSYWDSYKYYNFVQHIPVTNANSRWNCRFNGWLQRIRRRLNTFSSLSFKVDIFQNQCWSQISMPPHVIHCIAISQIRPLYLQDASVHQDQQWMCKTWLFGGEILSKFYPGRLFYQNLIGLLKFVLPCTFFFWIS